MALGAVAKNRWSNGAESMLESSCDYIMSYEWSDYIFAPQKAVY